MSTDNASRLLYLLKARGPLATGELARLTGLTAVGTRQHLAKLGHDGLVTFADRPGEVGRPKRIWTLTAAGHARFPDSHGELTASLIEGVRQLFGADGLDRLIRQRHAAAVTSYRQSLAPHGELGERVRALARQRTAEGYMAAVEEQADGSYLLIENHCPICIAAKACQGFCRSEAEMFSALFGARVSVDRQEHLLSGARRCAYRIACKP